MILLGSFQRLVFKFNIKQMQIIVVLKYNLQVNFLSGLKCHFNQSLKDSKFLLSYAQ